MPITKNTNRGILGITSLSNSGIWDINDNFYDGAIQILVQTSIGNNFVSHPKTSSGDFLILFAAKGGGGTVGSPPVDWTTRLDASSSGDILVASKVAGASNSGSISAEIVHIITIKSISSGSYDTGNVNSMPSGSYTSTLTTSLSGLLFVFSGLQNETSTVATEPSEMTRIIDQSYVGQINTVGYYQRSNSGTSYSKTLSWTVTTRSANIAILNIGLT